MATSSFETTSIDIRNVVAAVLILLAIPFLYIPCLYLQEAVAARRAFGWPTVRGTVTISEISKCRGQQFRRSIRYHYAVNNRSYVNDRVAFGPDGCGSRDHAQKLVEQYPLGNIMVWVNPDKPEIAVLKVGTVLDDTWSSIYWMTSLSIGALVVAGLCLRASRDKQISPETKPTVTT